MQFMTWGINKPDIKEKRAAINETHWAFWDHYEDRLIARGPVQDPADPKTALGSIHVADLDKLEDVKVMAYDEPYAANGLFKELIVTRFENELPRTQFQTPPRPEKTGYFIYCKASADGMTKRGAHLAAHNAYCEAVDDAVMVCRGALLTDDGAWNGAAYFIEVDGEADANAFLAGEPYNKAGLFEDVRVVRWRRGGRANAPQKK